MKYIIISFTLLSIAQLSSKTSLAQVDTSQQDTTVAERLEVAPRPADGYAAFYEWLYDNITYPEEDRQLRIEGRVMVQFIIEKDGSISNVQLYPGTEGMNTKAMEDAALNAVKAAEPWIPGMQDGEPVRVKYQIPIKFKLNKVEEKKEKKKWWQRKK